MSLAHRVLPEQRRPMLRHLLTAGHGIRVIEAHSGLSALIGSETCLASGEALQFDALWVSSLTSSAAQGLPDIELYLLERRIALIEDICQVSSKPIIVDGDTGGDAANLRYLVARLEAMGVSALVIEDKLSPKRNSLCSQSSHLLEDPRRFAQKISDAQTARLTSDFMVFARIESLIAGETVEDALARARSYVEAGASGLMIHCKDQTPRRVIEFLHRLRAHGFEHPVICVPTTYNNLSARQLFVHGASIVVYANHLLRAAHFAMCEVCKELLRNDKAAEVEKCCTSVDELLRLVGYEALVAQPRSQP
ncbi:MAG TPA: hypothetical protein DIT33_00850 [Pseudomonas sp.]|uniref:isocitrate lyase/phosphoenolpyruvate mutase family protein n=1 Tax=Pseudomonas sp. TaxID=306 RepID=UPI000EC2586C|nr:isocitrate lyase/phosphoenolpyruvate mutase family protein [Pseudomonas sp.]HCN61930.1 hypothetical protein [Pseudomonas sp.]